MVAPCQRGVVMPNCSCRPVRGRADRLPTSGVHPLLARYQEPNPLDLLFFASDAAARRAGLPQGNAQIATEVAGEVDVQRLRQAIAALHRVYPVTAARLELSLRTGRPRWRLDVPPPDPDAVLDIRVLRGGTHDAWRAEFERLFVQPIDATRGAPVRFHLIRGLPTGDVLMLRWPHGLMDARGGGWVSEELSRLYESGDAPQTLFSAGDELRPDYGPLLDRTPLGRRLRLVAGTLRFRTWRGQRYAYLARGPIPADLGRLRCILRHLSAEQTRQAFDNALRVCGVGRFPDYLRACALSALHEMMAGPVPPDALYTTINMLDRRNRRQPLRWCCNLTTSIPVAVPAGVVKDRRQVADLIREQTGQFLAADAARAQAVVLWMLTRLPTSWLGAFVWRRLRAGAEIRPRLGMAPAPSLPLGLMGPATRPLPTYCGRPVINYYGCRPPVPDTGYALQVNLTADRMNILGVCYEGRVPVATVAALIERLVARLLE